MPTYNGTIVDKETGTPLPGATISIRRVATILKEGAANSAGKFSLSTDTPASHIVVSNIDYQTTMFPAYESFTYELNKDFENTPEVIVYSDPPKKKKWWPLIAIGIAIAAASKKKKRYARNNRR